MLSEIGDSRNQSIPCLAASRSSAVADGTRFRSQHFSLFRFFFCQKRNEKRIHPKVMAEILCLKML
jgi:hypothetical protein